jgi:DNA-binding SARP family transcriptional activator/predicted ATPase
MARLSVRVLGGFEAVVAGRPLAIPSKKLQALLAYVALARGRPVAREALADLLWGAVPTDQARDSLRQALAALRKALGPARDVLVTERDEVGLKTGGVDVDALAFEAALSQRDATGLGRAVELYRGDLLAGLVVREEAFEDWLAGERARWRERAFAAMEALLEQQASADPTAAVETAGRLLALEPVRESVHRALMRVYAAAGRASAAIRQYQLCAAVLHRELRVQPDPATRSLYMEILRAQGAGRSPERAPEHPVAADAAEPAAHDTPLVGRATELGLLREGLTAAREGKGRVVAILGEAGIGKSRLVAELMVEARRAGVTLLVGRGHDTEQIVPLRPWSDVVRQALAVVDVRALAPESRAELGQLVPDLGDTPASARTPRDAPRRLFEAVAQLLEAVAARGPLLFVLEDVHWADEMSVRLTSFVARRLATAPALLVATIRTEEIVGAPALERLLDVLDREQRLVRVTLGALSRADTGTLVRSLAGRGGDTSIERLSDKVWTVSRGQPFMAVEAMRALLEGAIDPEGRDATPHRVQDLVASRLARLGERARQLAALAAVIGRPFDFALLQHAAGLGEADAAVIVEELARRQVLGTTGSQLDFAHDRIREVARAQILPAVRSAFHAAVARAIEAVYADDPGPYWGELALHHRENGSWERAATCWQNAGRQARDRAAHREAIASFEEALRALARLPATRERLEQAIDLRIDTRSACIPLGDFKGAREALRAAETLAQHVGNERRLAWVWVAMGAQANLTGDPREGVELVERALAAAGDDAELSMYAMETLLHAHYRLGNYRTCVDLAQRTIATHGDLVDKPFGMVLTSAFCPAFAAQSLAELGDFAAATSAIEQAERSATRAGHQYSLALALLGRGVIELRREHVRSAMAALERGRGLCQAGEFALLEPACVSALGLTWVLDGRVDDGVALVEQGIAIAEAASNALYHSWQCLWLAQGRLHAGRLADARIDARRALSLARERHERGVEAWSLWLSGELGTVDGDRARARAHYDEALAIAKELGMRPLEDRCRRALSKSVAAR